jgi:PII-like signaling protein
LYEAVLETMIQAGIRNATVKRGIAGFGTSGRENETTDEHR